MVKNKGFSLIELLVAVAIMAILSAVGVTAYRSVSDDARDTKRKADIDAIAKALETQFDPEMGRYPDSLEAGYFTSGTTTPQKPEGGDYDISWTDSGHSGFQICATLEKDSLSYCKQSSQGKFIPTPTPTPPPIVTEAPTPTPRPFKYVFATSTLYDGNLGGIAGADAKCQARAEAAGLPGTYMSWTSSDDSDAKDRLPASSLPYKKVDGVTVAIDSADLTNDQWLSDPINIDETGAAVMSAYVWTGTFYDGTNDVLEGGTRFNNSLEDCRGWTTNTEEFGTYAFTNFMYGTYNANWAAIAGRSCNNQYRLFCFEK